MSLSFRPPRLPHATPMPGHAPVARIDMLDAGSVWWLRALRLWDGATRDLDPLGEELTVTHGPVRAARLIVRLADLLDIVTHHPRRPLWRHAETCGCVGADEAAFTQFCTTATFGEREDAMMLGCLLFRPDIVPLAISLAQGVGLDRAYTGDRGAPGA